MSTMVINIISVDVANRYSMHKYNFCNKLNNTVLSFKMFLTSALELNYLELSKSVLQNSPQRLSRNLIKYR